MANSIFRDNPAGRFPAWKLRGEADRPDVLIASEFWGPTGRTLTQSATYTDPNSLALQHTLTPPPAALTQSATYTDPDSLALTHDVTATLALTQSARYDDPNSLAFAHSMTIPAATLTQSALFTNSNSLAYAHVLTPPPQSLTAGFFDANVGDPYWSNTVLAMRLDGDLTDIKGHTAAGSNSLTYTTGKFGNGQVRNSYQDYYYYANSTDWQFTTAFTIEFWVYPMASANGGSIVQLANSGGGNQGIRVAVYGSGLPPTIQGKILARVYTGAGVTGDVACIPADNTLSDNAWHHVAYTWDGSVYRLFIDGTSVATANSTLPPYWSGSQQLVIGGGTPWGDGAADNCIVDDLRITKNVARYTSNFTAPTVQFAADTRDPAYPATLIPITALTQTAKAVDGDPYWDNVALLLHADGASSSYIDETGKVVTAVGTIPMSTVQKKFGDSSFKLPTTGGNYVTVADDVSLHITNPYTIEFWVYVATGGTSKTVHLMDNGSGDTGGNCDWYIELATNATGAGTDPKVYMRQSNTMSCSGITISRDAWHHIAIVRPVGNQVDGYVDGVKYTNFAFPNNAPWGGGNDQGRPLWIGARQRYNGSSWVQDTAYLADTSIYLDDIRITKDVARYSTGFTAPTAPFPTGGDDRFFSANIIQIQQLTQSAIFTDSDSFFTQTLIPPPQALTAPFVEEGGDPNWSNVVVALPPTSLNDIMSGITGAQPAAANSLPTYSATGGPFGGGQIVFDNSQTPALADGLQYSSSLFNVAAGDSFTLEFWLNITSLPSTSTSYKIVNLGNYGSQGFTITHTDGQAPGYRLSLWNYNLGSGVTLNSTSTGTWQHVAVSYDGSRLYLARAGTVAAVAVGQIAAVTSSLLQFGRFAAVPGMDAALADIRFTKGVAKYTSTYTPPTALLPTDAADTFYAATVQAVTPLTAPYLNDDLGDTFFAAGITTTGGTTTLTQSSTFTNDATFYTHTLVPPNWSLTQSSRFDNAPTLNLQHSVASGAVAMTQSARYDDPDSLALQHSITAGAATLTQSTTYTDPDSLALQHTISTVRDLTQSVRFDNGITYNPHVIGTTYALTQSTIYTDPDSLAFAHTLAATAALTQSAIYTDPDSLAFQHSIATVISQAQSVRFDNAPSLAFAHTLLATRALTQSTIYTDPDSLALQHSLNIPTASLTETARFDNAQSYFTQFISWNGATQPLTQDARFDNAQTFNQHSISYPQALTESARFNNTNALAYQQVLQATNALAQTAAYTPSNTFFAHTSDHYTALLAPLLSNVAIFFGHRVAGGVSVHVYMKPTVFLDLPPKSKVFTKRANAELRLQTPPDKTNVLPHDLF